MFKKNQIYYFISNRDFNLYSVKYLGFNNQTKKHTIELIEPINMGVYNSIEILNKIKSIDEHYICYRLKSDARNLCSLESKFLFFEKPIEKTLYEDRNIAIIECVLFNMIVQLKNVRTRHIDLMVFYNLVKILKPIFDNNPDLYVKYIRYFNQIPAFENTLEGKYKFSNIA